MSLLVDQYTHNGTKMLKSLANKREEDKRRMVGDLLEKKKVILAAYEESKSSIKKTVQVLQENSIGSYEKEWRARQALIREKIAAGMAATRESEQ